MPVVGVNRDKLFERMGRTYSECSHIIQLPVGGLYTDGLMDAVPSIVRS